MTADREFQVMARGYIRDRVILANFRNGLRSLRNPETGALFTEDEIARATQVGSRWWIEADAIDQLGQLDQRRAIYLSDQIRVERASTAFLEDFHGALWDEDRLPATGGSGTVNVPAVAGTIIVGSTTIPDPAAYQARDGAGKKYQVFGTVTTPAGGVASVTLAAIDTGSTTNLHAGDKLTWITRDPSMGPECTVAADFTGGTDTETDAEFADRLMSRARYKQAAGNDAHFRAWGRAASNAIEDAYVYPCALHAGTVVVAITQKRGNALGPLARIPSVSVLATAIAYLTPPGSPVVPARASVLVVPVQSQPVHAELQLQLAKGTAYGWTDSVPFPTYDVSSLPSVISVASQTDFTIACPQDATLPGQLALATLIGDDAPAIMLWDAAASVFHVLSIASIEDLGANLFRVLLTTPASFTVASGVTVSPAMARHALVSAALEEYFDELGPGDLFDTATDPRGTRCVRFPRVFDERGYRVGAVGATRVMEALGGSSADAVAAFSVTTPTYPASISDGPKMLTLGAVGVYAL